MDGTIEDCLDGRFGEADAFGWQIEIDKSALTIALLGGFIT